MSLKSAVLSGQTPKGVPSPPWDFLEGDMSREHGKYSIMLSLSLLLLWGDPCIPQKRLLLKPVPDTVLGEK